MTKQDYDRIKSETFRALSPHCRSTLWISRLTNPPGPDFLIFGIKKAVWINWQIDDAAHARMEDLSRDGWCVIVGAGAQSILTEVLS